MRVLLDEQLPRQLARFLASHEVFTVQERGWAGLRNGDLLQRAADIGFEVFVTADQNLQFQLSLARSPLRVVVLVAQSNRLADLTPLVPHLLASLPAAQPGEVTLIGA